MVGENKEGNPNYPPNRTSNKLHDKPHDLLPLPPLDLNGRPISTVLFGPMAGLDDVRTALGASPVLRQKLQLQVNINNDKIVPDKNGDLIDDSCEPRCAREQAGESIVYGMTKSTTHSSKVKTNTGKRSRDEFDLERNSCPSVGHFERKNGVEENLSGREQLLSYIPSVLCTCSSWNMKNCIGELIITSIRVLFVALKGGPVGNIKIKETELEQGSEILQDVAIDGRCIALHALDSSPLSLDPNSEINPVYSSRIYCQISDPKKDQYNEEYASGGFSKNLLSEGDENYSDQHNNEGEGDDGLIEVYFTPISSKDVSEECLSKQCQKLFDSLTWLADLNPNMNAGEEMNGSDLFSFMSLLTSAVTSSGENFSFNGNVKSVHDDEDNDMAVCIGGCDNDLDDDASSEGATEEEQRAMLSRLDNMLVVPVEYEIASSEEEGGLEGQFDDADERHNNTFMFDRQDKDLL